MVLGLVAALLLAGCNGATDGTNEAGPQEFDVVFEGARVIDPERRLDEVRSVGIRGDVIAAVTTGPLAESLADGGVLIDAAGLVLAPGFVDLHAHGQGPAAHEYQARDGVTTALELEWGVADVQAFLDSRRGRSLVNYGATVNHGAVRGLEIVPQEERADLEAAFTAASSAGEKRATIHTHVRSMTVDAMQEVLANAVATGAPLHIVHVNSSSRPTACRMPRRLTRGRPAPTHGFWDATYASGARSI